MTDRTRSFWPLPGRNMMLYPERLAMILEKIDKVHDFRKVVQWVSVRLGERPEWTGKSIRACIISPGFANKKGRSMELTDVGRQFLRNRNTGLVLGTLIDRIWGIREVILWLSERPMSMNEIHSNCNRHKAKWKGSYQEDFRLRWLRSLGCVQMDKGRYLLTPEGVKVAEELREEGLEPEEAPSPHLHRPSTTAPTTLQTVAGAPVVNAGKSQKEILEELERVQKQLRKEKTQSYRYGRSRELVQGLKQLYDHRCQLCNPNSPEIPVIKMGNGERYVEVHHIQGLGEMARSMGIPHDEEYRLIDTYKNAVVLCCYHHKLLHKYDGGFKYDTGGKRFTSKHNALSLPLVLNKHL